MSSRNDRLLVVSPHHDDEVIGCGGLICQVVDSGGWAAAIVIMAGWSGVRGKSSRLAKQRLREAETRKAAHVLGAASPIFLRRVDRAAYSDGSIVHDLALLIQDHRPTILAIPHADEADLEHRTVGKFALEAAWLAREGALHPQRSPARDLNTILGYEVWSPIRRPDYVVDITDVAARKELALHQYRSQLLVRDYVQAAKGLNAYRGAFIGTSFAEAFSLRRLR